MIRIQDVYEVMLQDTYEGEGVPSLTEQVLYDLLLERPPEANISHQEMPTMFEHMKFVRSQPYKAWYLIQEWPPTYEDAVFRGERPEWVGAVYLTKQNEIGVFVFERFWGKGYASGGIKLLMKEHEGPYLANVSPENRASGMLFFKLGFKHIQNTYKLE